MFLGLPAQLQGQHTEAEAVADALYRAVLAFDLDDEALLRSAVTGEISMRMPGIINVNGIQELKEKVFDRVSKLDTTHFLSNMRVNISSAATARATCSATARHVRPGKGFESGPNKYMSGGLYSCELV